jgi:hypothetical protein
MEAKDSSDELDIDLQGLSAIANVESWPPWDAQANSG